MSDKYFDFKIHPKSAWLTVNRDCNFRCKWCYSQTKGFRLNSSMQSSLAINLISLSKSLGIENINLIGGEPTLWDNFLHIIKICKMHGLKVGAITNGERFSDDEFWDKYKANPCDYLGLSAKAGNKEDFEKATGVDLYDSAMLGLQRAMEFHKCGFSTVYNNLVGKEGLLEIANKCRDIGAQSITISLCSAIIDKKSKISSQYQINLDKLVSELMEIYPILDKLYNGNLTLELFIPLCLFPEEFITELSNKNQLSSICHVHDRSGLVFDTNGDVLPCNTMINSPIAKYFEDYMDRTTLIEILNSDKMIENYKKLLRYPSEVCTSCKMNRDCKGGCILNWTQFDPSICKAFE